MSRPWLSGLAPVQGTARLAAVQSRLGADFDALLVTNLTNVRYLSGFTGSNGHLLVLPDRALLLTDGRYAIQAPDQIEAHRVEVDVTTAYPARKAELVDALAQTEQLGLEADNITWSEQRQLVDWLPKLSLVPAEGVVEDLREVKDEAEIDRIKAAVFIADKALEQLVDLDGLHSTTERQVANRLESAMQALGASGPAYETIVASGSNAAKPHARPSERRIGAGDMVVIDVGAVVDGYRSDMTRTFVIGAPSAAQREMVEVVTTAQAAGVAAVSAGVAASAIDDACRSIIADAGFGDAFMHGTGHGVGLDIHERPAIASTSAATLAPGHVITVEPGVYLPEHGGVRIEDLVLVTATGAEVLTGSPKIPLLS